MLERGGGGNRSGEMGVGDHPLILEVGGCG